MGADDSGSMPDRYGEGSGKRKCLMKALIIEDNRKLAASTAGKLAGIGYEAEIARDGEKGLEMICSGRYALALVDIQLPKLSGMGVISRARACNVMIPIIVISVQGDPASKTAGLRAGADDYLAKPFTYEELFSHIDAVTRRCNMTKAAEPLVCDTLVLDPVSSKVVRGERRIHLSKLEFNLLEYLMRRKGRIVTKRQVLDEVWDCAGSASAHVVEMGVCALRKKINWPGEKELLETRRGFGYVIE